ncbi:unnamed protein product [Eruca vesicaria subsp. sativa]|uniref:RING-type domain-containing protein n=1 Tax=Eruca vesicaria subsp. sativa TaxID=29727 RepID=A0ABC8JMS8_ERUVS|nr:unnamed protein product [Eruca vesicaria subsp. sativa]
MSKRQYYPYIIFFSIVDSFSLASLKSAVDDASSSSVYLGGLANLAVLVDQLKLNRLFSYHYTDDCIGLHRCLSTLKGGEEVRKLDCRHVFHNQCLEGWIQHLNFNCALCRSSLISCGGGRCDSIPLDRA